MDQDFVGDESPSQVPPSNANHTNQQPHQNDEFDFGATQHVTANLQTKHSLNSQNSHGSNQYGSYNNIDNMDAIDSEVAARIKEEEEKIQQRLRQKSNVEYELKRKRKEDGQKQLEEFQEKKQQETVERKKQNRDNQKKKIQQLKQMNLDAGWKKVAASVPLKQGQHPGKKDITRMREAIINKRQDQK